MKVLAKKAIIMLLAVSIVALPSIQVSAQPGAGAGSIAGLSTASAIAVGFGILVAGFIIAEAVDDDDLLPAPLVPTTTTTTTTTTNQGSSSTTTTTTN